MNPTHQHPAHCPAHRHTHCHRCWSLVSCRHPRKPPQALAGAPPPGLDPPAAAVAAAPASAKVLLLLQGGHDAYVQPFPTKGRLNERSGPPSLLWPLLLWLLRLHAECRPLPTTSVACAPARWCAQGTSHAIQMLVAAPCSSISNQQGRRAGDVSTRL
jgi:hypothetical protein